MEMNREKSPHVRVCEYCGGRSENTQQVLVPPSLAASGKLLACGRCRRMLPSK